MGNFPWILEKISDLNLEQIQSILDRAKILKRSSLQQNLFPHYSVYYPHTDYVGPLTLAILFKENSTRTQLSFQIAALNLKMRFLAFEGKTSSLEKGEDLEQNFLTLRSLGVNLCVYRTPFSQELSPLKANPPLKIINAGDGQHQHPTQALLDLFTMLESGFDPRGKIIAIIGDCLHSRVSHSLLELLPLFGAKVILSGPPTLMPKGPYPPGVEISSSLDETLAQSDLLYLLRVQKERHGLGREREFRHEYREEQSLLAEHYFHSYGITFQRLKKHGKFPPIFHAGPANIGIELDQEIISSPLYKGHEQVQHSIYMRMSILEAMVASDIKEMRNLNGND